MGGSRFRAWLEARLPWYSEHTERLRNVKSEIIVNIATDTTVEAHRVIDDYERAEQQRVARRAKP